VPVQIEIDDPDFEKYRALVPAVPMARQRCTASTSTTSR
jgi:hypothetical protein